MENIVRVEMVLNVEEAVKNIKARIEATKMFEEVLAIVEKIEAKKEAKEVVENAIVAVEEVVAEEVIEPTNEEETVNEEEAEEGTKITGRLKRRRGIEGDSRVLNFYVKLTTKNGSLEELEEKFALISEYMENELGMAFTGYPYYKEEGTKKYVDSFGIAYSHGDMKPLKKEIKKVWKKAKELFGIK